MSFDLYIVALMAVSFIGTGVIIVLDWIRSYRARNYVARPPCKSCERSFTLWERIARYHRCALRERTL